MSKQAIFPSFSRRGGCAKRRRGGYSHRNVRCEQPPRPLHQRWLRSIFFMSRPPLLKKEGNIAILILIAPILWPFASALAQDVSTHRALIDRYCVTCHAQRQKDRGVVPIALEKVDLSKVAADAE